MNLLDPSYPGNPGIPLNCPRCGVPLRYMGTFTLDSKYDPAKPVQLADVHVYDCREHGRFDLTQDGLQSQA